MEETERSLHDAIMIVRRAIKNDAVVAGGGAIEMEVSKYLRDCSRSVAGKEQLIIAAMAKGTRFIFLRQLYKTFILFNPCCQYFSHFLFHFSLGNYSSTVV